MSLRRLAIWPTLPLNTYFRKPTDQTPFPLNQEGCRIFSLARQAIWNASKSIGLQENDEILTPAYHHGSEVEALLQSGLKIKYYELNDKLEPDLMDLESLITKEVKAFYLIHYLGFPQNAAFWKSWCEKHQLIFIEDAAQAFLAHFQGKPLGSFGQMGIFCLYKTYGVPDGGAVICSSPPSLPQAPAKSGWWGVFKRHFNWIATHRSELGAIHIWVSPTIRWWKVKWYKPHDEFNLKDPNTPPTKMTMSLLPKLLSEDTIEIRRKNYQYLLDQLSEWVPLPFQHLPEGACPFAFPVEMDNPTAFLKKLRKKGVMGLLFWINPHPSLPVESFPQSKKFREKMLALPVHQELNQAELDQIINAVKTSI